VPNICCYERKPYAINTTISSIMSEDGCAKASIDCVKETSGNAKTVLNVEDYCGDYAKNEQLEEIKKNETQVEYKDKNAETEDEKEVLFIGPGQGSDGKAEVLSLPDLTPMDLNLPAFPDGEFSNYVGRYTSDGLHMCGGSITYSTASCYLLTTRGYEDMPRMMTQRDSAASIETPLGWWVTGGYDLRFTNLDTTELWTNNQWQEHVRLPEPMEGHCMTRVNQSHILMTGGGTTGYRSSSSYLYSEETGFTKIEDMKTRRRRHGCSVIDDNVVFVAGGTGKSDEITEYLDLTTLTWSNGPELPSFPGWDTKMIGSLLLGDNKIFKLVEQQTSSEKQWQWVEVGELKNKDWLNNNRKLFNSFVISENFCN